MAGSSDRRDASRDRFGAGEVPNLTASLEEIGQDPARVLAETQTALIGAALADVTAEAVQAALFGAPSSVVGAAEP